MRSDRIAHLFSDPGPFATTYVDASRDQEDGDYIADLQAAAACDLLQDQGAPEEVLSQVRQRLKNHVNQPAPVSRFVVATQQGVLLDELTLTHRPQPTASWDTLPDLGDWVAAEDSTVPFVLALVDHEGGDVRSYRSDPIVPDEDRSVGGETEYEHKIRGGGWSHLRYQHHVDNVWRRNAAEVAAEIERQVNRGVGLVLLGGDPRSCAQVKDLLSDDLRATVVHLDSGSRSSDGGEEALQAAVNDALWREVVAAKLAEIRELRERLGRDDSVAIGVGDIVDAFVRGQVGELLIDPVRARDFEVRPERHPGFALGAVTGLPDVLPADRALLAAAAVTGADIVVTRARTLGDAPSAALLRWNQPSEGTRA
jgi:hypothetical protein